MSKSERNEHRYYDESDSDYKSGRELPYIQISLPSTRIEVEPNHILFKQTGDSVVEIAAKLIKAKDFLIVMRDGKQETEMVFETAVKHRQVPSSSTTQNGVIIVNNVCMKPN